jgi:hypothetical protein
MMRSGIGAVAVVAGLVLISGAARAQGTVSGHEYGVDIGMEFQNVSSLAGSGSTTLFRAMTPVDVRVGFPSATALSLEGRFTFAFNSRGFGANASYYLGPDLNLIYRLGGAARARGPMGPYLTGGLGIAVANAPGAGGTSSGLVPSLNGGIGTRIRAGTGAWRLEAFLAYAFKNAHLGSPATLSIGARVGLSLWH